MVTVRTISVLLLFLCGTPARAQYLELLREVADQQGIPDSLLLAVAWVESRGVLTALNIHGDAYYPVTWTQGAALLERHAESEVLGVGVMQVEAPIWGRRWGVSAQALYPPQVNIPAGARILRQCLNESGGDLWQGVGCYHSHNRRRQQQYVQRVWSAYTLLRRHGLLDPPLPCGSETANGSTFGGPCRLPRHHRPQISFPPADTSRVALRPVATPDPSSLRLPPCAHQPPFLHHPALTQPLLVFGPEQTDVARWLASAGAIGMCVGCSQAEVVAFHGQLGAAAVVSATPAMLQQLGVACVPTFIQPARCAQTGECP